LETSAGPGSQIGSTLEDIKYVWDGIYGKYKTSRRVGICIDTAHIFVGGYDISNQQGMRKYLDEFNRLIGFKNITNFHINDSRYDMGSRHDEHRGLQHGKIFHGTKGLAALKYLVEYSKKYKIPMILETHGAGSLEKPKSRSKSLKHISKHTLSHSTIQNLADNTYEGEIALIKSLI
jgi:deoxyribonuclease-4